jgi:hypothetical protein
VILKVVARLPGCNEDYIKQFMHFQIPCLGLVENLIDVVDWSLYGSDPPGGGGWWIDLHWLGSEDPWLSRPKGASESWDPVACWFSDPDVASES